MQRFWSFFNLRNILKCIEKELIEKSFLLLNCSPPYISQNKKVWCTELYNLRNETINWLIIMNLICSRTKEINSFLKSKMYRITENNHNCLLPCTTTKYFLVLMILWNRIVYFRYKVERNGLDYRGDWYGVWVQFSDEITTIRSHLAIEPMTFVTRVGGIIGVGKELLWVIIFLCNYSFNIYENIKISVR